MSRSCALQRGDDSYRGLPGSVVVRDGGASKCSEGALPWPLVSLACPRQLDMVDKNLVETDEARLCVETDARIVEHAVDDLDHELHHVVRRTLRHPQVNGEKRKALSSCAKCPTSLVAGARYAQRCPVEFGVPMEVVIAA